MNIHKYHIFFRMKMRLRLYHFTCNCYIILGTSNRIRQDISSCLPIPSVPEIITFYDMSGKEENRNPGEWNGRTHHSWSQFFYFTLPRAPSPSLSRHFVNEQNLTDGRVVGFSFPNGKDFVIS